MLKRSVLIGLLVLWSTPLFAWHHGNSGSPSPPPTAPVLQNVAVNFGQITPNGRGSVRLSSQDITNFALPVSGLDILTNSGTACATWTLAFSSGRSSTDFTIPAANTAEGASAITPVISSSGASHITGDYVWNVTCKDGSGNSSNTATLTYHTISLAANYGQTDPNFGNIPSGFGATSGYKLLISTGVNHTNQGSNLTIGCTVLCTLTEADTSKPAGILSISMVGGAHDVDIRDVQCTGNWTGAASISVAACMYSPSGNNNIQFHNITAAYSLNAAGNGALLAAYGTNGVVDTISCQYCGTGLAFQSASGWTISNVVLGHFSANAIDMYNANNMTLSDITMYAPEVQSGGVHVDCWQAENGGTPHDITVRRLICVQAGGGSLTQGPVFPGHFGWGTGYMDDGTVSHGPGHIMTMVTFPPGGAFYVPSSTGSQFFVPGFISGASPAIVSTFTSTIGTLTSVTDQVIGSPSGPVNAGSYGFLNWSMRGILYTSAENNGYEMEAEQGTSDLEYFAYGPHNPTPLYSTTFTGTIVGNQLTVPASSVVGYAGLTACGGGCGYSLSYSGCTGCTLITAQTSGPSLCLGSGTCVFTLNNSPGNVSSVAMAGIPPVNLAAANQVGHVQQQNCEISFLHGGTATYLNGWTAGGFAQTKSTTGTCASIANTTVTHVYDYTSAPPSTAYANGDPQTYLQGITQATWNAMTPAQTLATYCHAYLPKVGGTLDNGDGTFASPFKLVAGQGQWYDGTVITGCS